MKLVIADKEQRLLMVLRLYLEDIGHLVEITDNAIECLELLRNTSPDVLVLGTLFWGGSEGVLATMTEEEALRGIPIILLENPLCEVPDSSLRVVMRMPRPIRVGALAKFLASIRQSQELAINLLHDDPQEYCAKLQRRLSELQQDSLGTTQARTAG